MMEIYVHHIWKFIYNTKKEEMSNDILSNMINQTLPLFLQTWNYKELFAVDNISFLNRYI